MLVQRGSCNFTDKAENVQRVGARFMLLVDTDDSGEASFASPLSGPHAVWGLAFFQDGSSNVVQGVMHLPQISGGWLQHLAFCAWGHRVQPEGICKARVA